MSSLRHKLLQTALLPFFSTSRSYWEKRYRYGGTSGGGSYGELARFKARFLNGFVKQRAVRSVIEFGCGDGNQLALADYPLYLGLDVASCAIEMCQTRFRDDTTKAFLLYDNQHAMRPELFLRADLGLSLDVIYHLVEDKVYQTHLRDLFSTAGRYVIIYSSDEEKEARVPHVRHRNFSRDVEEAYRDFRLESITENERPGESFCRFFVFARTIEKQASFA